MAWFSFDNIFNFFNGYVLDIILISLFIINIIFAISLIFLERRRSAQSVWAWLLILLFTPVAGFVLYMLFGRTIYRKNLFQMDQKEMQKLENVVNDQLADF